MATWQGLNAARVAERYEIIEWNYPALSQGIPDNSESRYVVERGGTERVRWYDPWRFPEVVNELAGVKWNDDASVLNFVQHWGLLGQGNRSPDRELVAHLQRHGQVARFLLKLINLLHEKDSAGVYKHLGEAEPPDDLYPWDLFQFTLPLGVARENPGLEAGARLLTEILNHQISEVHTKYSPSEDGTVSRLTVAPKLLAIIYCHIGAAAEGKLGYYQCTNRYCHKWSPYNTTPGPKRKYCPPQHEGGESLCSRQERYYRSLERQGNA